MEDAEQYHQCPNLLSTETRLIRLMTQTLYCIGVCWLADVHGHYGIPGNHKPQLTKQAQRQCMLLSGYPRSGKEPWLHKTMEKQHFQAFSRPGNMGRSVTEEHPFRQPVTLTDL